MLVCGDAFAGIECGAPTSEMLRIPPQVGLANCLTSVMRRMTDYGFRNTIGSSRRRKKARSSCKL
jgi:hypothetical protein